MTFVTREAPKSSLSVNEYFLVHLSVPPLFSTKLSPATKPQKLTSTLPVDCEHSQQVWGSTDPVGVRVYVQVKCQCVPPGKLTFTVWGLASVGKSPPQKNAHFTVCELRNEFKCPGISPGAGGVGGGGSPQSGPSHVTTGPRFYCCVMARGAATSWVSIVP